MFRFFGCLFVNVRLLHGNCLHPNLFLERLEQTRFSGSLREVMVIEFTVEGGKQRLIWALEPCFCPFTLSSCLLFSSLLPLTFQPLTPGWHLALVALIKTGPLSEHATLFHARYFSCFTLTNQWF